MRKVEEYKEKRCNNHGFVKKNNISRAEADGLKEIKKKIKNKEMVVFCTDKSNKLAADSIRNFETSFLLTISLLPLPRIWSVEQFNSKLVILFHFVVYPLHML